MAKKKAVKKVAKKKAVKKPIKKEKKPIKKSSVKSVSAEKYVAGLELEEQIDLYEKVQSRIIKNNQLNVALTNSISGAVLDEGEYNDDTDETTLKVGKRKVIVVADCYDSKGEVASMKTITINVPTVLIKIK